MIRVEYVLEYYLPKHKVWVNADPEKTAGTLKSARAWKQEVLAEDKITRQSWTYRIVRLETRSRVVK